MSFFNAYQLLTETARIYNHQRETFSTVEIAARINEIKYLSSQKKVPKLSLRKEIVHLERQLGTVMDVEKNILNQKKNESVKVKSMRKQITELHTRLAAVEDKDMQKKLDRLTQLLGDYLAKKTTEEEVKAAIADLKLLNIEKEKRIATKFEKNKPKLSVLLSPTELSSEPSAEIQENVQPRIMQLQQRLELLKGELELLKILKKDSRAQGVAEKITALEQRLKVYTIPAAATIPPASEKREKDIPTERNIPTAPIVERREVKHTILFSPSSEKIPETPPEKPLGIATLAQPRKEEWKESLKGGLHPLEFSIEEPVPMEISIKEPEIIIEKPQMKPKTLFALSAEPSVEKPARKTTAAKDEEMSDEDLELEKELPLPPPPKMSKK